MVFPRRKLSRPPYVFGAMGLLLTIVTTGSRAAAQATEDEEKTFIDVVVDDAPRPTTAHRDPTAPGYVVRGEALARSGATMTDLLQEVPGTDVVRSGGAADLSTVSIRGASSAQTPIYLAGIRLNDEITGSVDLSTLPLWMLHRVEIYRGHAPPSADVLGLAGAIFLEPRLPRLTKRSRAVGFGEIGSRLGLGSFGHKEVAARLSAGTSKTASLFSFRHRASQGNFRFLDDGGTRFDTSDDRERERSNGDHQENDAWALGRITHEGVVLTTLLNVYHRRGGSPGLQLPGADHARFAQSRLLAGVSAKLRCGDHCTISLATDGMLTRYGLDDPHGELGGAKHATTKGHRLAQRVGLSWQPVSWSVLNLGVGQTLQGVRLDQRSATGLRARRWRTRPELSALFTPLPQLRFSLIGALECHNTEAHRDTTSSTTEPPSYCEALQPTGRLGLRWQFLPDASVFANAGRYARPPSLGELYGLSAVAQGNDELEAEQGLTAEVGVDASHRWSWGGGFAQLLGFLRQADELIAYRRSSIGAIKPYNVGQARVVGAEAALGADLWRTLSARVSATWLDPRDRSEGRSTSNDLLPFRSALTIAPSLSLRSPRWKTLSLDKAQLTARYRYRSSRFADPAGLIELDAQSSLDLDALLSFDERVIVRGRLANLLDQRGFDLLGYPLPGRSFFTSAEVWW